MSSGSGWPVQVLADTQEMSYYDVEPVRNTGPIDILEAHAAIIDKHLNPKKEPTP